MTDTDGEDVLNVELESEPAIGTGGAVVSCPRCGENNRAVDVRCWACDRLLRLPPVTQEGKPPGQEFAPGEAGQPSLPTRPTRRQKEIAVVAVVVAALLVMVALSLHSRLETVAPAQPMYSEAPHQATAPSVISAPQSAGEAPPSSSLAAAPSLQSQPATPPLTESPPPSSLPASPPLTTGPSDFGFQETPSSQPQPILTITNADSFDAMYLRLYGPQEAPQLLQVTVPPNSRQDVAVSRGYYQVELWPLCDSPGRREGWALFRLYNHYDVTLVEVSRPIGEPSDPIALGDLSPDGR